MSDSIPTHVKVTILARPFGTASGVADTVEMAVALARIELESLYPESRPSAYRVAHIQGKTSIPVVGETTFRSWGAIVERANRAAEPVENRAA